MADKILIADLERNPEVQGRVARNQDVIDGYKDQMLEGDVFPPIDVFFDGAKYRVADGFQRVEAAELAEFDTIIAEVHQGGFREAKHYACGSNTKHGLPRSNADKRRVALMMLKDEEWGHWSDSEIARHCGVTHPFVGKVRRELESDGEIEPVTERTVKRGGEEITMDTSQIGSNGHMDEMPPSLRGGEQIDPNADGGYDGPLDFEPTESDAGHRPLAPVSDVPESWANTAPNRAASAELTCHGILMENGEINLGDGRYIATWPETVNVLGMALKLVRVDSDEDEATVAAHYRC